MVTAINNPNLNSTTKSKNAYHIGGIPVEFPYQPYGTQLAFMGRVISTLDRALRDGHCHALLESPTGTGKSLSLLCSTLAWQYNYKFRQQHANLTHSKPDPQALADPLGHGGGFIPETQPSSRPPSGNAEAGGGISKRKKVAPTIFYSSRTHAQISQVIREYRKTSYRVPMAVLASRKHYCTNAQVNGKENIDEECKFLLKDREAGCSQFKNACKVKGHPSLQKGGSHEVHDIEDLVKVGKAVKGCSYYAARSMADDAQLIFCPYSYVINPIFRGAMDVDIRGSILIFDEAHNIEDVARDAGSVDVEEDVLYKLQTELEQLCSVDTAIYQPLYEMTQDLLSWINRRKSTLQKREFQHYCSCWTGDKALAELQEANISQQCFPVLLECALKAIKAATDLESDMARLSGMAVMVLEGLFSSLTYFFSKNGCHASDYQLALQRLVKRDKKNPVGDWTLTLSLWCLNPAVVFRDLADLSLSIILTSGTLSPMNSFSSELGIQFGTCLEAPHVVDIESQVWAAVISTGPDNYPLNASYKTADQYAFQDTLGQTLEEICMIVPAGSLVFFPSYKLMEKLCTRWRETGQWSRLNTTKPLYVEPRGGNQEDDFDSVLKGYYDSIRQPNTRAVGKKRRVKKLNFKRVEESSENGKNGAAFLAVFRGKVSEGMDFSDDNARVVIVVGIPFPNIHDIQVGLKKCYNDAYKTSKNLLSGNEWYCQQAFRALNQAIGRCIRHRFDYGAIILLDERYKREQNRMYISKWLRKCIRQYDSYSMSIEALKSFFRDVKENVGKKLVDLLPNCDTERQKISHSHPAKDYTRKENHLLNKLDNCGGKLVSTNCDSTSHLKFQDGVEQPDMQIDEDIDNQREIIDLECDFHKESRYSEASSHEDLEITVVKETPGMGCNGTSAMVSSDSFSKDKNYSVNLFQTYVEYADQESSYSESLTNASKAPGKVQCSVAVTPTKDFQENTSSLLLPEDESTCNWSVNSHRQKKRRCTGLPFINLIDELPDSPDAQTPGCSRSTTNTIANKGTNGKIEFVLATNGAEPLSTESKAHVLSTHSCSPSCISSDFVMDRRLQISCLLCKSPLGLPENQLYVMCSLTTSSKVHLLSLVKQRFDHCSKNTTSIPVLMADVASVDPRLCNGIHKNNPGRGVWCEEDGCVFNSIYCPFCSTPNCLGVQILAADASNVLFLNKVLFYFDGLEVQNFEASMGKASKQKETVVQRSSMDRTAALNAISRFSYSPQQNSGGWRTTRTKVSCPAAEAT